MINILEKLRELFYLLDSRFIIKGHKSGTASWKRCRGQGMGKGHGAFTPSPGTQTSCFWVFMEAASHRHGRSNHWPLTIEPVSSPSPLPLAWGLAQSGGHVRALGEYGAEISNFLIMLVSFPGNQPFPLDYRAFQK